MLAGDFTIQLYSTKKDLVFNEEGEWVNKWKRFYTTLTTFTNGHSNPGGTYDENLSIKNNSQYSLTFSISKIVEGQINPLFHMIVENRRLRLTTIDYIIDFIITAITPQVSQYNVIYNVTCQDVFSYDWSKQNIKISYNSLEEYNKALFINRHAENILEKSKQKGRYMIDPSLETKEFADFPNMLTTTMIQWTERTSSTLELTDTTPFSAMIELANKYNAALVITYPFSNENKDNEKTIIGFKNQQTTPFKGLYVRPEVNLNNFSISRKTDNFCSILHVDGSEDADGNIVGLMPDMPHEIEKFIVRMEDTNPEWHSLTTEQFKQEFYKYCENELNKNSISDSVVVSNYFSALERIVKSGGNFLYNFDYYYNNGLMSKSILDELEKIFSIDLRNSNLLTAAYSKQYNRLYSELMLIETEIEDYIASIAAEYEYQDNLLKEKEVTAVSELTGQDLVNYNNSKTEINNISFNLKDEDNKTSYLDKIWIKNGSTNSVYINNGEAIYGTYFINNKIVDLTKKKEEINQEYFNYMYEAHKIESKYIKDDGTIDWKDTKIEEDKQTTIYSSENSNPDYIEYCYFISQAQDIYTHVGPCSISNEDGTFNLVVNKKGYYQTFIEELEKLLSYRIEDMEEEEEKEKYKKFSNGIRIIGNDKSLTITKLLSNAQEIHNNTWKKIYDEYGDFICEASYSDSTQITGESLYLVAQKEFASRCNPSVDYSATIIDLHKVLNVNNSKIEVGDMLYFYNKDLYNQYNGNLIIEVPFLTNARLVEVISSEGRINKENIDYSTQSNSYTISSTKYENEILSIYIKIEDQTIANSLILSPTIFKVDGQEVHVLNKYLDMKPKPIQLQITGITKKLRDATTQLTVSTNRMVENLLGKILRRSN